MSEIQLISRWQNQGMSIESWAILPQETSNATPVIWFSIPVAINSRITIEIDGEIWTNDFSTATSVNIKGGFIRGAGNVIRTGAPITDFLPGFSGIKPSVTITANISTQSIDCTIQGTSASLTWTGNFTLKYNS